jgi:hypothetical protein
MPRWARLSQRADILSEVHSALASRHEATFFRRTIMQNTIPVKNTSPVKTGNDLHPPVQNVNTTGKAFPENKGNFPQSPEK